jgi:hypothetical protein
LSGRWQLAVVCRSLLKCGNLVLRPTLHTRQVENSPACLAAPNSRIGHYFIRADSTLVLSIGDILVCSRGDIRSLRFRHSAGAWLISRLPVSSSRHNWLARNKLRSIACQRSFTGRSRRCKLSAEYPLSIDHWLCPSSSASSTKSSTSAMITSIRRLCGCWIGFWRHRGGTHC